MKSILQTIKAIIISARYYFPWELCEDGQIGRVPAHF